MNQPNTQIYNNLDSHLHLSRLGRAKTGGNDKSGVKVVDGRMLSQLNLAGQTHRTRFSVRSEKIYEKAIAQTRDVLDKAKLSSLVEGK